MIAQAKIGALKADMTNKVSNDFLNANTQTYPWSSAAIASGTATGGGGTGVVSKHPGMIVYNSSISANSGFRTTILNYALLLQGSEKTTIIFKTASTLTDITRRIGFHDAVDQNDAIDGVYGEIVSGVISGKTANTSTRSTTSTNYTLLADTWYRFVIELNSDATLATYTLYADDSTTVLWTNTLATNIPKATTTGHTDICTYAGTSAIAIGSLDYMDIVLSKTRRVL